MEADNLFLDENVNFKEDLEILEDPRTPTLRRISYGIVLPAICCLGIIGNMLNLLVLTRRNMRGTAYIYMREEGRDIAHSRNVSRNTIIPKAFYQKIFVVFTSVSTASFVSGWTRPVH
uniref:G-protein coupled receptors family 1 profile domain-containing protein n=1 Tax=Vespula pensylvanica TaxID=30213 RepID=A0A834NR28_VESPE|nr:hypothetical protein H0235_012559 [Vespula pensylvanica]